MLFAGPRHPSLPRQPRSRFPTFLVYLCGALLALSVPASASSPEPQSTSVAPPEEQARLRAETKAINEDLVITFDEFPLGTAITNQYANLGIIFGGDSPFLTRDSANPTSPVLSGSPTFQGAIEGHFVDPADGTTPVTVSGFSLDAGFFDEIGSVRLRWFDSDGAVLGQRAGSIFGIEEFLVVGGAIASWRIEIVENEPAGFAVDNVSFVAGIEASILFREKSGDDKDGTWGFFFDQIPGFDHTALHLDDLVYESHPGYLSGTYVEADGAGGRQIAQTSGVQAQHSKGTFAHDAMPGQASPVVDFEEISIDLDLARSMRDLIEPKIAEGAGFQLIDLEDLSTLAPAEQKGGGGTFTCVGLVEWACEQAGHNDGQGFVLDALESFVYPTLEIPPSLEEAPLLSPQLLNYSLKFSNLVGDVRQWLQGFLDPVDFLLTDPLGRRLGFTPILGEVNEIPGAFFSGDGNLEQFSIPNPLPGDYRLELIGKGEQALGAFSSATEIQSFDEVLAPGERMELGATVTQVPGGRGDVDGDGDVDSGDLDLLVARLNTFVNDLNDPADLDGNGLIDQLDADLLESLCSRPGCALGIGPACVRGPKSLCLQKSRFTAAVEWRDFDGNTGSAQVVPYGTADSGLFWFFGPNNWEMLIKVLDGCNSNDRFWVFAASTTNVEYTLRVEDALTGAFREYFNPLGRVAPAITDTDAFATCATPSPDVFDEPPRVLVGGAELQRVVETSWTLQQAADKETCQPSNLHLCLNGNRFRAEVVWEDFQGNSGVGQAVPLGSNDSGMFWFFDSENWEVLVKVLNGCNLNQNYWVFAAATTNVGFTLRVTDTMSGEVREFRNPLGVSAASIIDTSAFPTCP